MPEGGIITIQTTAWSERRCVHAIAVGSLVVAAGAFLLYGTSHERTAGLVPECELTAGYTCGQLQQPQTQQRTPGPGRIRSPQGSPDPQAAQCADAPQAAILHEGDTCSRIEGEFIFSIVSDGRAWARIDSLKAYAFEVLRAVEFSDERPIGLDFSVASGSAEVILVEGAKTAGSQGDSFQLLYRNMEGEPVMFLELRSAGVDKNGYEHLAFESLLAFSNAIDGDLAGLRAGVNTNHYKFPYQTYPPVPYDKALAKLGDQVDPLQNRDNGARLTRLRSSAGDELWGSSMAYEVSVADGAGEYQTIWVDAFYGTQYTQQDLDTAHSNAQQRRALLSRLPGEFRTQLEHKGELLSFLQKQIPLSPKELERKLAQGKHEHTHGFGLANL